MALHLECVPEPAHKLAAKLFPTISSLGFVLAGGTGLALQLGHRVSVDFDLFTSPEKYPTHLLDRIRGMASMPQVIQDKQDTLDVLLDGVKCSFFSYPYPFSDTVESYFGVALADTLDIAAMKLIAIAQRGAKKDFVDLYVCLRHYTFEAVFSNARRRFGGDSMNPVSIGKALVYFADARKDPGPLPADGPMPDSESARWELIEAFFREHVQDFVAQMIAPGR